jgi:hypothetical protein
MALGGGTFVTQNKVLPGSYINFVSAARASATLSERGVVAMPLVLDWGVDNEVFAVTSGDFQKRSLEIFGYAYTEDAISDLRELFRNARLGYFYKVNGTGGVKATSTYGTAKYKGAGGNKIKLVITQNEDETTFDFELFFGTKAAWQQTGVAARSELQDNNFVTWTKAGTITLSAGISFTGGVTGTTSGDDYQTFIDKIEGYTFNTVGIATTDQTVNGLAATWTKRMRDEMGLKFQTVLYRYSGADYEGIISVENKLEGETGDDTDSGAMVFWVTGAEAGCDVNKSILNKVYDGEYHPDVDYTQIQLENAIKTGKFAFHRVNADVRVLSDINTLVNTTVDKGDVFKENQTVRVIDQIANDIAVLFNSKYLGVVPNDEGGRISLWADIVKHHEQLQEIRAIENFSDADVVVEQGNTKRAVVVSDAITVVNAMAQLYMTVTVS